MLFKTPQATSRRTSSSTRTARLRNSLPPQTLRSAMASARPILRTIASRPGINPNQGSTSIEHEGFSTDDLTEAHDATTTKLVKCLHDKWNIPLDSTHIIRHREINGGKTWPGIVNVESISDRLDWPDYQSEHSHEFFTSEVTHCLDNYLYVLRRRHERHRSDPASRHPVHYHGRLSAMAVLSIGTQAKATNRHNRVNGAD
jgi:hypothetical protein